MTYDHTEINYEYYRVPDEVTVIGDEAFIGNKQLRHLDLNNVTHVGDRAFQECSNLESVVMKNVTSVGTGAFEFCKNLRTAEFGDIEEAGDAAFSYCGKLDIPKIPETLRRAGAGTFSHTGIRQADLHWFREIPDGMFSGCTSLVYADVRNAGRIGISAFEGCRSMSGVSFGSAEEICDKAFHKCDSLMIGELPESLRSIGADAFGAIKDGLVIPAGVRTIGENCFGPVDTRKKVSIHRSLLYEMRKYFSSKPYDENEDDHFYLWESGIDITVLDDDTDEVIGFLPLYSDLDADMRQTMQKTFRPDNTFDYDVLDNEFFAEMRWNQRCMYSLAAARIRDPYELTGAVRNKYLDYLSSHAVRIARQNIRDRDTDMLSFLHEHGMIGRDIIQGIIDYSISMGASECTALLLECQAEASGQSDPLLEDL